MLNDIPLPDAAPRRAGPHDATLVLPKTFAGTVIMPRVAPDGPVDEAPQPADERPAARPGWWQPVLLFAVPAALTVVLGRVDIGVRQLWNDEHATWYAATLPWHALFHLLDHIDRVLTLYYVLMHAWVAAVGDDPTMLRMPSVAAMACAAGWTALIGRRLLGSQAGLVAGVTFAILPATSRYAQEARPYALAVAAATLATLLLLVALDHPRWPFWLAYAASVVLTGFFHIVAVGVVPAHGLLVWYRYQKSGRDVRLWKSLGALALIAAMVMPLAYAGSDQSSAIDWIRADRSAVVELPVRLFGSYPVAAAIAGAALMAAATLPFVRRRQVVTALLVWAIAPPVLTYVTFPLLHLFLYRYLLFTLPAWALLAAGGLDGISRLVFRRAWPQALLAAVALPTLALLVLPAHQAARTPIVPGEPDYRAAAQTIAQGQRSDDGIVFAGTKRPPRMGIAYEMRDQARPADVLVASTSAELGSFGVTECPVTLTCLDHRKRIWLVSTSFSNDPWSDMPKEKASALRRVFTVARAQQLQRIQVYLLVRKRGE